MAENKDIQVAMPTEDDYDIGEPSGGARDESSALINSVVVDGCPLDRVDGVPESFELFNSRSSFELRQQSARQQSESRCAIADAQELDQIDGELPSLQLMETIDHCVETRREQELLADIENKQFSEIKTTLTAKVLMDLGDNPLLLAIRVVEKLHDRADKSEHDKEDFIDLADRVEEFTLRFLDPMKYQENLREAFSDSTNPQTECILETAIKLEQRKFFDHPIIIDLMLQRWYGDFRGCKHGWWLFLNFWCVFDIVLFPLMYCLAHAPGLTPVRNILIKETYKTPYFKFVRDALSYLVLLGLHFAICLKPSQLSFRSLEWAILIFLLGRLIMEGGQIAEQIRSERRKAREVLWKNIGSSGSETTIRKTLQSYLRDRWNIFDLIILFTFFCGIVPLRIHTSTKSQSVTDNRILETAEYLYGFNTMLLTFRVFGHMLEASRGLGTIQIALFHVITDVGVVLVHFMAIILAFSSTITKVYLAESSMIKQHITGKTTTVCNQTGIGCWWKITRNLAWAFLQMSEELTFFDSVDTVSALLARLLFAAYLFMTIILLINMFIALLSNTYQKVQDNSKSEWAFKKAITIQTYRDYPRIPVPFNVIFFPAGKFFCQGKKCIRKKTCRYLVSQPDEQDRWLNFIVRRLLHMYRHKYGDYFPPTCKLDQVLQEMRKTENMVNQVLHRSFRNQRSCDQAVLYSGQEVWEVAEGVQTDGLLLTCEVGLANCPLRSGRDHAHGARYLVPFSPEFPHFEVIFLETGELRWLGLGVVNKGYGTTEMPGWYKGSVGYHTDDGRIFQPRGSGHCSAGRETGGRVARRGDRIRCTIMFENERDGKVEVVFTMNDRKITIRKVLNKRKTTVGEYGEASQNGQDQIFMDSGRALYPYIGLTHGCSVLAKMFSRDTDEEYETSKFEELDIKISETNQKLDILLARDKSTIYGQPRTKRQKGKFKKSL